MKYKCIAVECPYGPCVLETKGNRPVSCVKAYGANSQPWAELPDELDSNKLREELNFVKDRVGKASESLLENIEHDYAAFSGSDTGGEA